jgi:hypothetical protein
MWGLWAHAPFSWAPAQRAVARGLLISRACATVGSLARVQCSAVEPVACRLWSP